MYFQCTYRFHDIFTCSTHASEQRALTSTELSNRLLWDAERKRRKKKEKNEMHRSDRLL